MRKKLRNQNIYLITLIATMSAMSIVLDKVSSLEVTKSLKITFYAIPLLVTGIIHGPKIGFLTGLISGVVMQLTSKYGITLSSPFWAIAPIFWGLISGLIFKMFRVKERKFFGKVLIYTLTVIYASIMANLANTFAMFMDSLLVNDSWYTKTMILIDWPGRLLTMLVTMIPYIFISFVVCERLKQFLGYKLVRNKYQNI